jgi:beta-glucosidase
VVQLYVRDDVANTARPDRELVGFARIHLEPGEATTVALTVPASRLAFYDRSLQRVTEPGSFTFFVGASAADIRAEASVEITGDTASHPLRDSGSTSVQRPGAPPGSSQRGRQDSSLGLE